MKKYYLFLSVVLALSSCSKKETCYHKIVETKPVQFTLVDFENADLDSVYINKFQSDDPSTIISNIEYKLIDKSFDQGRLKHAKLVSDNDTTEMISFILDHITDNQTVVINVQPVNRRYQISAAQSNEIDDAEIDNVDCTLARTFVSFLKDIKDENGQILQLTYSDEYNMGATLLLHK